VILFTAMPDAFICKLYPFCCRCNSIALLIVTVASMGIDDYRIGEGVYPGIE